MSKVQDHSTIEHRHRNVHGGLARAAIFGVSDGLTTNISLVLGVAAASTGPGFVPLAGLAGLLAGSFTMAAGEYVSMRAQAELFARELRVEERRSVPTQTLSDANLLASTVLGVCDPD